MSKLQRLEDERLEDEMYEVAYTIEIPRLCRNCKHHHGQIYGDVGVCLAEGKFGSLRDFSLKTVPLTVIGN